MNDLEEDPDLGDNPDFAMFTAGEEGREAFAEGKDNTDNPYDKVEEKYWYCGWLEGWLDARDEREYEQSPRKFMREQEWENFDN